MTVIRFDSFGDPFRQLDRLTSQLLSGTRTPLGMAMDVWQADDGYHAVLDLPGWMHRAWRSRPSGTC